MYKLYDSNMNQIPFPEGVVPLDFLVGSIGKDRNTEVIPGRNGVMNYGYRYDSRPVTLNLLAIAHDRTDYYLLRNEIYALFDVHDEFYLVDDLVPSRRLKVAVDESYIPDKFNHVEAEVTINCRTLDSLFWESTYTTLELHDTGFNATAEKYGLADGINVDKMQYRFQGKLYNENKISLESDDWEAGTFWSTGTNNNNSGGIRTKGFIDVIPGETYTFQEASSYVSAIKEVQISQWDGSSAIGITDFVNRGEQRTFIAQGDRIKIGLTPIENFTIQTDFVDHSDERIKMKLELGEAFTGFDIPTHSFNVYNAGNVPVDPESMMLNIQATFVHSEGDFTIRNKTTNEEIILKRASEGSHFRINGMVISLGSITNIFRDTNRRFISLLPGDNVFEILNGTFEEIRFDFKYLYK